tara:strand:- start:4227 stop:5612 length:1386 start_codon:yes stop_codon:yes gene_type:complete
MDIVFCIIPKIDPTAPTPGVAVMKQVCVNAGYTSKVIDLNIDLYNKLKLKNLHTYYWDTDDSVFFTEIEPQLPTDWQQFESDHEEIFQDWINQLQSLAPKFIGLSLLSMFSRSAGIALSLLIRKHLPLTKIIWGGPTVDAPTRNMAMELGFCDIAVIGDGEEAILSILRDEIPSQNQIADMDQLPFPDYTDIDWAAYDTDENVVYITGSRGCVKSCTFCNVSQIWPRYINRSGNSIVDEIEHLSLKYNRYTFRFTDSLINGNMKAYREFVSELISRQLEISWSSQWIIRSIQSTLESDFDLAKRSGCSDLEIGVEHFSQDPRWHMGKKFTDEAMWHTFDLLKKFDIPSSILMIIGYPTETDADHQVQLDVLEKLYHEKYVYSKSGNQIMHFYPTPMMLDGEIRRMVQEDLTYRNTSLDWALGDNTYEKRQERYREFQEKKIKLENSELDWMARKNLRSFES